MTVHVPIATGEANRSENLVRHLQAVVADRLGLADYGVMRSGSVSTFPGFGSHAFALADTTLDVTGAWRLIELNTSNAAGGTAHGGDRFRVHHEVGALLTRRPNLCAGEVIVRAYSQDTRVQPEILVRTALYADHLEAETGLPVVTAVPGQAIRADAVTVVHGPIPAVTPRIAPNESGGLTYDGHNVAMLHNPNLLGQIARRDGRPLDALVRSLDPGLTHEGTWLTLLGFDKARQQDLVDGTSLNAITYVRTRGIVDAIDQAIDLAVRYDGAFIKPDAASGGTLAVPVDPSMSTRSIADEIASELTLATAKYGPGWEKTCPLVAYEFVHARPVPIRSGGHRWDLRWQIEARPDELRITPLLARACPTPVGGQLSKANAVSNITGRESGTVPLLAPADLVLRLGLDDDKVARCAQGLAAMLTRGAREAQLPMPA